MGFIDLPISSGGGGSPSGAAGGSLSGSYPNPSLTATGVSAGTYGSASQIPVVDVTLEGRISSASSVPISITGTAYALAYFDSLGDLAANSQFSINSTTGGLDEFITQQPNGLSQSTNINTVSLDVDPLQNSPNETVNIKYSQISLDPNSSGFTIGTAGQAARFNVNNLIHSGTSDVGAIEFVQNNFNIGNGTDPIDVKGLAYAMNFGQFNANVNISGPIQGIGFQPNVDPAASISNTSYIQAFYDAANIGVEVSNYQSFNATPTIDSIANNNNYSAVNINPSITNFNGNSSGYGVTINGNWGAFDTGGFNGINVNATATNVSYANGINVTMDNISVYPGTVSSLIIQDLTITFNSPADNNAYQVTYVDDVTAGSESAVLGGNLITVHMESGVSTALQIKAAIEANPTLAGALTVTVSGVGSNAQVSQAATNFTGGTNPGSKKAAYLDGDVEITGGLTFGGALSIGKLNAYASQALVNGGGTPSSIHMLITQPTVANNVTVANADLIGVNTAMLLNIGDNATVTTSFVGLAALGLPAVISMGTGSTVDKVSGATFALSLDAAATGGTIADLSLCRALAIPNGVTTVTRLHGYKMDLPFGSPGVTSWGFYESPGVHNYMQGDLLIGGTAGTVDTVSNSSVGLEINSTTKAFLNARMTTTERDALTAINGMQIYNTTTDKLQVYAGGAWVDLH